MADHARVWAHGLTVTDPTHVTTAAVLRQRFRTPRTVEADDGSVRELADYDRAFGRTDGFDRQPPLKLPVELPIELPGDEDVA